MTEPRIEVWNQRAANFAAWDRCVVQQSWRDALKAVDWHRETIRVRSFYDRHLRRRVVQILAGNIGFPSGVTR